VRPVLVLSERDNVATALEPLDPGRRLALGALAVTVLEPIPVGHKLALAAVAAGEQVVKHGHPIGIASAAIPAGAHAHTHNVSSSRGRGDLAAGYSLGSLSAGCLTESQEDRPAGAAVGIGAVPSGNEERDA
jgi:pantoate kinase